MRLYLPILLCAGIVLLGGRPAFSQEQDPAGPTVPQPSAQATAAPRADTSEGRPYTSDGVPSLALYYWLTPAQPKMRTGESAPQGAVADLNFPRRSNQAAPGLTISIPASNHHTLRFSYFRTRGNGNTTTPIDLNIFGTPYVAGDYLNTGYMLQNFKMSLDYLSWPFPVNFRNIRIKTFWELQFTSIRYVLDAPLKPITDEDGAFIDNSARATHSFVYPTFGLGVEKFLSRRFRVEAKASGFALPDRPALVDLDAFVAYRGGSYEFMFGGRGFHFRTSPKDEQFIRGTLSGAYVGFRWYP